MNLKSRSIFKNFSAVFLLLLIVTAVFIPFESARAGAGAWLAEFIADAMLDKVGFFTPIYFIVYQILNMCLMVVTILVYFGSWLIDVFLDEAIYTSVLDMTNPTSAVSIGWTTVRDACNTFFILFLLLIAFSTILRIQAYSAKSLLPKLIISLFLINFSATIAMMVIDFGQVFMFEIKTWMGAGFVNAGSPLTSIVDYYNNEYNFIPPSKSYLLSDVVGVAFAVAYSTVLGLLYIMLALFLMVRIIVFVILIIVSPFAFFSIILPGMRTYTSQWWQSLVSNAIFGPVFLFFIFLAGKMAQSMQTFPTPAATSEISSLSYIIANLIPHIVAMGMLMAAIPVTQKLGAAGASKIIGGTAGLGKVGIGAIAGAKLAGGGLKKAGGGTVGRAHSGLKGGVLGKGVAKNYNKMADKIGGGIKSLPIAGRILIKHEAGEAEKKKEAIAKHEKILESRTDKDKKKYVDSFKLDKNAQAEAKQAMFNVLAKDNGAGLTNKNLQKMGYEKEVAGKNIFDEEKFNEDYGQVVAHGHDTSKIETYRPDLINDKKDRLEKIDKIAANGDEKNIKLATLADPEMDARLRKAVGKTRYNNLINSKPQTEKDDLAEIKENQIIKGLAIAEANKDHEDALDVTSSEGRDELFKQQTDIAYLSGTEDKAKKMRKVKGVKIDKEEGQKGHFVLDYEKDTRGKDIIDKDVAGNVVNRMTTDELIDQNPQFLKDTSHMIKDPQQFSRINKNKNITTEQSEAIKESISGRMDEISKASDEYKRLEKAAGTMGCSITKPDKKKPDDKDKDDHDFDPSYGFASSKPQSKQSTSGNKSDSDQKTVEKLNELAREEGFEGIDVSEKSSGINVGSAGFLKTSGSGDGGKKAGKVLVSPKVLRNTKELFETDKEFAKEGVKGLIKHEKVHIGKGPASEVLKREEAELGEYSKKEGVFPEDIKRKKVELHKKYHEGGESGAGGEMQTEVERVNEAFKNPKQFIKDQARIHVTADVVHEGMDKMGEIEYGPENSGLHRTHSAFINDKVAGDITERMEGMRQDLVAKHNMKKGAGNKEPSDSGDDDTTVEGGDEFMTGGGEGGAEAGTKNETNGKETESGKIRKAYLKTNIAVGEADKIALGVIGKVDKKVGLANKVVLPAVDEAIEVNKRKLADPNLTNKQIREEELAKLKGIVKPVVSENADEGVKVAGDKAGAALDKIGERGGKIGVAAKVASKVVGNEQVQGMMSNKIKNKLDDKEEKPEAKKTTIETAKQSKSKQQAIAEERKSETVVKTEKVATKKDAGSVPVVKTEITSKSNVGGEISSQIKEALDGIGEKMRQEITNNVSVDSPQIDLKEIIDTDKIAETIKKGIDIKDVEKTLKDVKKSFDKFKGNNNESSSTTVFGAGISTVEGELNRVLTVKDHKERDIKLATITQVMNEIKSGMKKQDRSSAKENE